MHYSHLVYTIPFISAFIGWFVSWVSIKMLFYPAAQKQLLGIKFQGVFPKNKNKLAVNLGKLANKELLPLLNNLQAKLTNPKSIDNIMPFVEKHIDHFLRVKLSEKMPVIGMFIGESTISELKLIFIEELKSLFPEMMGVYMTNIQNEIDIETIVATKIESMTSSRIEELLKNNLSSKLRRVHIVYGMIGFLTGLLQLAFVYISR